MLRMIQCLTHLLSVVRRFEVIVNIYGFCLSTSLTLLPPKANILRGETSQQKKLIFPNDFQTELVSQLCGQQRPSRKPHALINKENKLSCGKNIKIYCKIYMQFYYISFTPGL